MWASSVDREYTERIERNGCSEDQVVTWRRDARGHSMHVEVQVGLHNTPDMWRPSRMETTGSWTGYPLSPDWTADSRQCILAQSGDGTSTTTAATCMATDEYRVGCTASTAPHTVLIVKFIDPYIEHDTFRDTIASLHDYVVNHPSSFISFCLTCCPHHY